MFDKRITELRRHFGVSTLADWNDVRPEWIISRKGFGPVLLDHLRLYLAQKKTTLADDQTPEYWLNNIDTRIAKTLSYDDTNVLVPFTVLVDSREQQPFTFADITADATDNPTDLAQMVSEGEIDQEEIKLRVPTEFKGLPTSMGDYSIKGYIGRCHVERKSMSDAHGTILGWGARRERFEKELETLAALDYAAVVVECSFGQLLADAPCRGKKSSAENMKILHRQVLAWQQDFRVPWLFCDSRRMAEITTFRILQRFWKKKVLKG